MNEKIKFSKILTQKNPECITPDIEVSFFSCLCVRSVDSSLEKSDLRKAKLNKTRFQKYLKSVMSNPFESWGIKFGSG